MKTTYRRIFLNTYTLIFIVYPHKILVKMAEAERLELSRALRPLPVFKTGPFSRLGKLPTETYFNITF